MVSKGAACGIKERVHALRSVIVACGGVAFPLVF